MITVIVDDREARSGVMDVLQDRDDVSVEIRRLTLGDYEVDGRFLIERKTWSDLIASIKDGRLFQQGCRLAESSLRSVIILEDTAVHFKTTGMRREAIQGALISVSVFLGIPLLRSKGQVETARLMLYMAQQGRAIASGAIPRKGKRPQGKLRTQLHILQGLPGVGPERARLLLKAFDSVEGVLTATADELAQVDGIGGGTAKGICWAVRETGAGYYCETPG